MYSYINPLLKKEPSYVLLHVGSNDSPFKSSEIIFNELLLLKQHIEKTVKDVKVIISKPIVRADDAKAQFTLNQLNSKLSTSNLVCMDNSNIKGDIHLGRKGLHLNDRGNGRLALNIMHLSQKL